MATSTPALRQVMRAPPGVARDPGATVRPSRRPTSSIESVRTAQPSGRPGWRQRSIYRTYSDQPSRDRRPRRAPGSCRPAGRSGSPCPRPDDGRPRPRSGQSRLDLGRRDIEIEDGQDDVIDSRARLAQPMWARIPRISLFDGSRGLLLIAASSMASWAIVSCVSGSEALGGERPALADALEQVVERRRCRRAPPPPRRRRGAGDAERDRDQRQLAIADAEVGLEDLGHDRRERRPVRQPAASPDRVADRVDRADARPALLADAGVVGREEHPAARLEVRAVGDGPRQPLRRPSGSRRVRSPRRTGSGSSRAATRASGSARRRRSRRSARAAGRSSAPGRGCATRGRTLSWPT